MSQPDLARTLRDARPVAPAELRERVRLVAAQSAPPRRQLVTWRRALLVAVVAGAAVAAGVIATRPATHAEQHLAYLAPGAVKRSAVVGAAANQVGAPTAAVPPPSTSRVQRYSASLDLRVPTPAAVSSDTRRAVAIANSLGGYLAFVSVNAGGKSGYADIRLRIPKTHVEAAVRQLAALGRVIGENVQVQDLTTGLNATDRLIARLQRQLAALRVQPQTTLVQREIASITNQVERLQRGSASTVRTAHDATVEVTLSTPPATPPKHHHPGPLHGLGVAFRWIGIGAVYALAVGAPFLALAALIWLGVRTLRRRREDALLSRS